MKQKTLCRWFPNIKFSEANNLGEEYLPTTDEAVAFFVEVLQQKRIVSDTQQNLFKHQLYHQEFFIEKVEPDCEDDIFRYYNFQRNQIFFIRRNDSWQPFSFWPLPYQKTHITPFFEQNTGSFIVEHKYFDQGYHNEWFAVYDLVEGNEYKIYRSPHYTELDYDCLSKTDYIKRLSSGWHNINEIDDPVVKEKVLSTYK